jgi:hypothetical protein
VSDNHKLDDELAAWTDGLLSGSTEPPPDELGDLARIATELRHTIDPDAAPSETFRAQLTQRLAQEWSHTASPKRTFRPQHRVARLALMAAGITLVLLAGVLLTSPESGEQSGTAQGSPLSLLGFILIVGAASIAGVSFWIWFTKFKK